MISVSRFITRKVADYDDPGSLGSRLRARRAGPLLALIRAVREERGGVRILDVGGRRSYWNIVPEDFLHDQRVEITIANIDKETGPPEEAFRYVEADGCDLSAFEAGSFDIAHSNSVIEHVGGWDRMRSFAGEIARVAPRYFVQTPNFWFPLEPHCMTPFFHWLPRPVRRWLVMRFSLGYWPRARSVDEAERIIGQARLLDRKMMVDLFPDAEILTERILFLPKSFLAVKG